MGNSAVHFILRNETIQFVARLTAGIVRDVGDRDSLRRFLKGDEAIVMCAILGAESTERLVLSHVIQCGLNQGEHFLKGVKSLLSRPLIASSDQGRIHRRRQCGECLSMFQFENGASFGNAGLFNGTVINLECSQS
ncbi:hypothetical protein [Pandoraea sp. XY-2]|uniref:hypothetical protein n=1 Tax=Pandoraea sp. XY-2 TaxID=2518599 RepID=UPI0013EEA1EE|nr:hypothetical protein [Pandoraea sp. XY-2]